MGGEDARKGFVRGGFVRLYTSTELDQIPTALHAFQQPLHEGESTVFNSNFTECKKVCDGKDGNGGGTASAIVTKVLCIENGTLWHRCCEKKKMLIATWRDLKGPQMLKCYSSG